MFKEIKAVFKTKADIFRGNRNFTFKIERYQSGATAYGDKSGHSFKIFADEKYLNDRTFDTRYDGISTDEEEWKKFWKDFIENQYGLVTECISYEEKEAS